MSRSIVSRMRRFSRLWLREQRLWPLASTGLFGRTFAPGSKGLRVTHSGSRATASSSARSSRGRVLFLVVVATLTLLLCRSSAVIGASALGPLGPVYPGAPAFLDSAYEFDSTLTSVQGRPSDPGSIAAYLPHSFLIRSLTAPSTATFSPPTFHLPAWSLRPR
jgi:hypothetical protein